MEIIPTGLPGKISPPRVEMLPLEQIKPNKFNARKHPGRQIESLTKSIREVGFRVPVLIDENNILLAGHARLEAARAAGLKEIPAIRASDLTEAQKRAYMVADNRLSELGSWHKNPLKREIAYFSDLDIEFDFSALGFSTPEIDAILDDEGEHDQAEVISAFQNTEAVSKPGDLWQLDEHRILCGSALDSSSYEALLGGDRADMVFTDPPDDVHINGHRRGHREFGGSSGELAPQPFEALLPTAVARITAAVTDGAICYICMDWRQSQELLRAVHGWELKNICVWVKSKPSSGPLYPSQHEFVFVFKCGAANHVNNVERGRNSRAPTSGTTRTWPALAATAKAH